MLQFQEVSAWFASSLNKLVMTNILQSKVTKSCDMSHLFSVPDITWEWKKIKKRQCSQNGHGKNNFIFSSLKRIFFCIILCSISLITYFTCTYCIIIYSPLSCENGKKCTWILKTLDVWCLQFLLICGCMNLCVNSAERNSSPCPFSQTVYTQLCVRTCIMQAMAFTPLLRQWAPLVSGKPVRVRFLTWLWFFSGVCLSLSLSFVLCVFKWMGSKNPNIRSPLPHLPLPFYQLHLYLFLLFYCV